MTKNNQECVEKTWDTFSYKGNLISDKFYKRAFAVWWYSICAMLMVYGILVWIILVWVILWGIFNFLF